MTSKAARKLIQKEIRQELHYGYPPKQAAAIAYARARKAGYKVKAKDNPGAVDENAARELELYIENTGELYPQLMAIQKNLVPKKYSKKNPKRVKYRNSAVQVNPGAKWHLEKFEWFIQAWKDATEKGLSPIILNRLDARIMAEYEALLDSADMAPGVMGKVRQVYKSHLESEERSRKGARNPPRKARRNSTVKINPGKAWWIFHVGATAQVGKGTRTEAERKAKKLGALYGAGYVKVRGPYRSIRAAMRAAVVGHS